MFSSAEKWGSRSWWGKGAYAEKMRFSGWMPSLFWNTCFFPILWYVFFSHFVFLFFFFRIFFVPIFSLYIHFVFVLCQFKIFLHIVLYLILLLLCAAITIGIFINFITIYIFFPDLQFIFEKIIFLSFSVFVSRSNMSSLAFYIMHSRKETVVRKIFSFCSFSLFFLYCYDFTQFRLSTLIALLLVESWRFECWDNDESRD